MKKEDIFKNAAVFHLDEHVLSRDVITSDVMSSHFK